MNPSIESESDTIFEVPDVIILGQPRSGTHFLEESLASHPQIRGRGECFLRYQRFLAQGVSIEPIKKRLFINKRHRVNVGILMYYLVDFFTKKFGAISDYRILHILRNPRDIAVSVAQMEADRLHFGRDYRVHRKLHHPAPVHAPILIQKVKEIEAKAMQMQQGFCRRLGSLPNVLTIDYDIITAGRQTNKLPEKYARLLLDFLHLPYHPLENALQKTGVSRPVGNGSEFVSEFPDGAVPPENRQ